jgi:hypothetical protein
MPHDDAEALRLIERAVLAMQAHQHPGRRMYQVLGRLRDEVRQAQREAAIGQGGSPSDAVSGR